MTEVTWLPRGSILIGKMSPSEMQGNCNPPHILETMRPRDKRSKIPNRPPREKGITTNVLVEEIHPKRFGQNRKYLTSPTRFNVHRLCSC